MGKIKIKASYLRSLFFVFGAVSFSFSYQSFAQNTASDSGTISGYARPVCGSAVEKTFSSAPSPNDDLCSVGAVVEMKEVSDGWTWKCYNYGQFASCFAKKTEPIKPVCGSANGKTLEVAPATETLCSSGSLLGTVSFFDGRWKWHCSVSGSTADAVLCSAQIKNADSPSPTSYLEKNTTVAITEPAGKTVIKSSSFEMVIYSPDAEKVELRIKKDGSSGYEYFATANRGSSGNWSVFVDDIFNLPKGRHYFQAKAVIGGKEYRSNEMYLDIAFSEYSVQTGTNQGAGSQLSDISSDRKYDGAQREDSDGDGLSNEREKILGTNPNSSDTDKDGLPDGEEVRLGTNPRNPDSDNDGVLDGEEIRKGTDPLKHSKVAGGDKIVFEDPREKGEVSENYFIDKVELLQKDAEEKKILALSGKGKPNSFVTIFIYSEPIVITIKTDVDGNWVYELDKEFEDGEHEAYVAVTDNTGKITEKSEPIRFVKTAEAASIVPGAKAQEIVKNQTPTQNSKSSFVMFGFVIIIVFLAIALVAVGITSYRHNYEK